MALDELCSLMDRYARPDLTTAIDDVLIFKADRPQPSRPVTYSRVFALVGQGTKQFVLGDRVLEHRPGQYLVVSLGLPVMTRFVKASPGRPGLGVGITLNPSEIVETLLQAPPAVLPDLGEAAPPGLAVGDAPPPLLDAVLRLLRLLDHPQDIAVLAPLIKREILWRLITGEQGAMLRQFAAPDSNLSHIARTVHWIRENYRLPFRVEDLACEAGMSISTFHRNFQTVTAMSPIQFQKQIRLHQARLLLLADPTDIAGISRQVGYTSPSQFSREYRRHFGESPTQDARRIQTTPQPSGRSVGQRRPPLPTSQPATALHQDHH
ncbi:AraC family transcriptional regulator [Actinomadura decatromicini]|uniref:Helix-turn-helix domain-containing protein n=1 Tax=Actinomadura decatromicini TaxID=2604572 RepID=A0A5D3F8J9_9ACTN|nr:AraC family transcriptional regulator [Actinomadura decatromicini]TYK44156.1 helix-turn-helix domain-containing protein [Actinomadura decatromicini]